MPKLNRIVCLMLCAAVFGSFEAVAQGSVSGKVIDEETGEIVIGAYIMSGSETVATDFYGAYIISLPAGTHELKCSFIGMGEAIGSRKARFKKWGKRKFLLLPPLGHTKAGRYHYRH